MRTKRHCRNPPPPSNQEARTIGEDRISALPETVLVHILSYLSAIDAVRTGVLSKRWAGLWTWTPNLVFHQLGEWDEKTNNFIPSIDTFLGLHYSPKIQKLALELDYKGKTLHLDSSLDKWLDFATKKASDELDLQLSDLGYHHSWDFRGTVERYTLPPFMYTNKSMKRLDMSFVDVQPSDAVSWGFLQSLSFRSAFITESTIEKILLGSPQLKLLELNNCKGFDVLHIVSKSLKRLVVHGIWYPTRCTDVLQISAPNLLSLEISGYFYKRKVQLLDISSLVDATINFQLWVEDRRCLLVKYSDALGEILEKTSHVEKLTIGATSIKILSMLSEKFWDSLVSRRKHLILNVEPAASNISEITCFLQTSPQLERLQINMAYPPNHVTSRKIVGSQKSSSSSLQIQFDPNSYTFLESCWTARNRPSDHLLENLTTVEIAGFNKRHARNGIVVALVRSLLKHAKDQMKEQKPAKQLRLQFEDIAMSSKLELRGLVFINQKDGHGLGLPATSCWINWDRRQFAASGYHPFWAVDFTVLKKGR